MRSNVVDKGSPGTERSKSFVFVYGTLREGGTRAMSRRFPEARYVSTTMVKGSLYDLGAFPGLLLDGGETKVVGEVYEVDDKMLGELDELERKSSYIRKKVRVSLNDGRRETCWLYVCDPEVYRCDKLIPSGDWIVYSKRRRRESKQPG